MRQKNVFLKNLLGKKKENDSGITIRLLEICC